MASRKILVQLDIAAASNLTSPSSGFVGFSAKADGLYQKIGTAPELRLLTSADVQNAILADGSITGAVSQAQIFTMGVKLYNLTQGYIPYASDATKLLSNSSIYTDGTNVGIGTNVSNSDLSVFGNLKVFGNNISLTTSGTYGNFNNTSYSDTAWQGPRIGFTRYRGVSGAALPVASGDTVGWFDYFGYDGVNNKRVAQFSVGIDGAVSTGIIPGKFTISTANLAGINTPRLTAYANDNITMANNGGNVGIGTTNPGETLQVSGTIGAGNNLNTNGGSTVMGELRSYQANINSLYLSLKTDIGKSGLFRSNAGFFNYYDTSNGNTVLDVPFAGASLLLNTQGTNRVTVLPGGNVGIGNTSPTASLHIKAGTATANTAPLKLTSGVNLTTPESGAIEFSSSRLYFTPSSTRETVAFISDITAASHAPVTIGAIGSAPNANGMSISGQTLSLQPASANYGGIITTGTQTLAGAKTLSSLLTASAGIANNGSYTQSGTSLNTFTGTSTFSNATYSALFTGGNVGVGTPTPNQQLEITKNFRLPSTAGTTPYGIIYKGADRFIHDFNYGNNGTVTTDGRNTFVGISAGNLTMGSTATQTYFASYNTGIGYQSLFSNTTGCQNTANGFSSLYFNTTGNSNTANGYASLYSNTIGSNNTALGYNSGRYIADGTIGRSIGDNGLYLGYNSKASADGTNNEIVIGYDAIGAGSNKTVIGNSSVTDTYFGSSTGSSKLWASALNLSYGFKLGTNAIAGYVLTTDANGNGTWQAPPTGGSYTLPTASALVLGGVKIGSGITISSGVISVSTNYEAPLTLGWGLERTGNVISAINYFASYVPYQGAAWDVNLGSRSIYAYDFVLYSDINLKCNIESIPKHKIDIDYKQFEFKTNEGEKRYGVIAQELLSTAPEFVVKNGDYYAVKYTDLLVYEIVQLKEEVKELKSMLCR